MREDYTSTESLFTLRKLENFVNAAAIELGMEIRGERIGVAEKGYDTHGKCIVAVDLRYFRPTEVETLLGDPSKAKEKLSWPPKIPSANSSPKWCVKTSNLQRETNSSNRTATNPCVTTNKRRPANTDS